jgi:hypothetical protein
MVVNEVAANATSSKDLVELRVTSGGAVAGITVRSNPSSATGGGSLLGTLPNVCAAAGDLFVIHMNPGAETGESETSSKSEFATATFSGNYDGAWDVKGTNNNIPYTGSEAVVAIFSVDPPGAAGPTILDAVAFTSANTAACAVSGTCTTSAGFKTALDVIENATQWTPACGNGAPPNSACNDTTAPTAITVSASYAGSVGITTTAARKNVDTNAAGDWAVGAASLGVANP